jgi:hypothetical protein
VPRTGARLSDVERELARARGARRMLPWAVATAAGGGLIAWVAGGGLRAALPVAAVGLLFAVFLWATSVARCPACGGSLPARGRRKRPDPEGEPGPAAVERLESCPRCRARFE